MAKPIQHRDNPFASGGNLTGNRRKYRWEQWFSNPRTELISGVDYQINQSMMHQTIRNNASQRGVKVKITDIDVGFIIEVVGNGARIEETAVPA